MSSTASDITRILTAWRHGDPSATNALMPIVYDELRRIASRYLHKERINHTLQPTELVSEAFLRLHGQRNVAWQNRAHFFAIAAKMIRRILLDHARRHQAEKRGAQVTLVALDEAADQTSDQRCDQGVEILALDDALRGLADLDEFKASLVELRFYGGLSIAETAHVLDCSTDTVTRHWRSARAWLSREFNGG